MGRPSLSRADSGPQLTAIHPEPAHIHIEQAGALAKFWLEPVSSASSIRFSGHEFRRLEKQVAEHQHKFLEAWHDYFGA
ncbi:MAG: DUF4160 domain-containing protein [Planctomycetes bacterium]|nr:DUF4160 domain-containing protein [Planctomycetota bacterium]